MQITDIQAYLQKFKDEENRRRQLRRIASELSSISAWHTKYNHANRLIPLTCEIRHAQPTNETTQRVGSNDKIQGQQEEVIQTGNKTSFTPTKPSTPVLFDYQQEALQPAIDLLGESGKCALLPAPCRTGKTFFAGELVNRLRKDYPLQFPLTKPILWITEPSILYQTARVQGAFKNDNVIIVTYPQMTHTLGKIFVDWKTAIIEGHPVVMPVWKESTLPCLVIVDEAQNVKNMDSNQSRLMQGLVDTNVPILFMSATPASRPIQIRMIATALKPMVIHEGLKQPLTDKIFLPWIRAISDPAKPTEWSRPAMRRIMTVLEPHTIRFGKINYKHRCFIKQIITEIPSANKRKIYIDAFESYQQRLIEIGRDPLEGFAAVLVERQKFKQTAEILKADENAIRGMEFSRQGKQVILAFEFMDSLKICYQTLLSNGIPKEKMSIIMGGQDFSTERQRMIDDFQSERRDYMLLSFRAGGKGLSLHQYAPLNKKPRVVILPPVWNDADLVQVLGRAHGPNSDTTTRQYIVWYKNTIEEDVAAKVKYKCSCAGEVSKGGDTFLEELERGRHPELLGKYDSLAAQPNEDEDIEDNSILPIEDGDNEDEEAA